MKLSPLQMRLCAALVIAPAIMIGLDGSNPVVLGEAELAGISGGWDTVCAIPIATAGPTGCNSCDYYKKVTVIFNNPFPVEIVLDTWKRCQGGEPDQVCATNAVLLYRCELTATDCPMALADTFLDQNCTSQFVTAQGNPMVTTCGGTYDVGSSTYDPALDCEGI